MIAAARFIANDVISIVPLLAVALWLWGPRKQLSAQRQLVIKVTMAMAISMSLSLVLGHLFPHNRPFVDHVGYNFLPHSPDYSFPSDHGTVIFTFAIAFIAWHRAWSGAVLMLVALAIAWSRVRGRTLAARYGGRSVCWSVRLSERADTVADLRSGAAPHATASLPPLFCLSDSPGLGT
jgi:hypothetical protein